MIGSHLRLGLPGLDAFVDILFGPRAEYDALIIMLIIPRYISLRVFSTQSNYVT